MFTLKTAIAVAMAGLLGLQAYGLYSLRRSMEAGLSRIENAIESVREADVALKSEIAAQATNAQASTPKLKDNKSSGKTERTGRDRKLQAQLQKMLPPGTNLKEVASGFKTEKEFISAVHVSKNLGIPFPKLKAKITGNHPVSMEAAIRDLRPDLNKAKAKAEAVKGERQALETQG
jgi:hypothetical protein